MRLKFILHFLVVCFVFAGLISGQERFTPSANWKIVNECNAEFYIPSDFVEEKIQGKDSCVRKYRSAKTLLILDVLGYITPNETRKDEYADMLDYHYVRTKVDGKKAEIITFRETDNNSEEKGLDYAAVLFVPQMRKEGGNLTIWTNSTDEQERKRVILIFQSVRFPKE